jgi:RimJ/RimL family protein N-acetyltransferase
MELVTQFICQNGQEITLRPAVPEDASEIIETINSVALERSYILTEQFKKTELEEKQYIAEMDTTKNLLLVAVADGKVIGGLGAHQASSGRHFKNAHVCEIGLHLIKPYREQGIGAKMLEYALEWARDYGYKKLDACIFTSNKRSLYLFRKFGFVVEGKRAKQFRIGNEYIDEVIMGKIL